MSTFLNFKSKPKGLYSSLTAVSTRVVIPAQAGIQVSFFFLIFFVLAAFGAAPNAALASVLFRPASSLGLVGYWKFDDARGTTAQDSSGKGNKGVLTAGPTWVAGKHGKALKFDGVDDYTTSPDSSSLSVTSNLTISAWIKTINASTNQAIVSKYDAPGGQRSYVFSISDTGSSCNANELSLVISSSAGSFTGASECSNAVLVSNTWTHVTAVYSAGATTMKLYINGIDQTRAVGTGSVPASIADSTRALSIGATYSSSVTPNINFFNGSIDDVRIYNRALSAAEINTIYKSGEAVVNKIDPNRLSKGMVGYWSFDGSAVTNGVATDLTGLGNNGNLVNISTSTFYTAGKIGQGFKFDGVNDYVSLGTGLQFSAITYTAWVKAKNFANAYEGIVDRQSGTPRYSALLIKSTGKLAPYVTNTVGTSINYDGTGVNTLSPNQWYFLAMTYNSTSGLVGYVNGQVDGTSAANGTLSLEAIDTRIGNDPFTASREFNGSIDDVRIYNRALSPTEINALYKMGQETVNKTPVNRLSNGLVGYWTFDGKDIATGLAKDVSGQGNHGNLVSMATSSDRVMGKLGQALNFDGVNDIVDTGKALSNFTDGSNGTYAVWVYPTSVGTGSCSNLGASAIITDGTAIGGYTEIGITGGNWCGGWWGTPGTAGLTSPAKLNTWSHVALTVKNGTEFLYVNGVQVGTQAVGATTVLTFPIQFGQSFDGNFFRGKVDDARIYSRALSVAEVKALYNSGR